MERIGRERGERGGGVSRRVSSVRGGNADVEDVGGLEI